MIIPHDQLQPETLAAVIEEFVTRDGAIHGHTLPTLCEKIDAVKRQLHSGRVVIVFDAETETCTIVPRDELRGQTDAQSSDVMRG